MAQAKQSRIGELTPLTDNEIDDIINSPSHADDWTLAIDYVKPDTELNTLQDRGTKHISGRRIGFLTRTRLVPQSMLPSIVAGGAIYDGQMYKDDVSGKLTFTVSSGAEAGKKYVCPKPTAGDEYLPDIDTIYRDVTVTGAGTANERTIYTQYRYIPTANAGTAGEEGEFVPIPSDLVMVDGDGTVVHDDFGAYTRQIDINIGSPSAEPAGGNNVIFVDSTTKRLIHSTSGVVSDTYPSTQVTSPGFGSTFNVPKLTVNSTGHVTVAGVDAVTIPDTPARVNAPGLVIVGDDADIRPIGNSNSVGTVPSNPGEYMKVAAADHVHTARSLTLSNTNDGSKVYDGTMDVAYDFRKFLMARLPATAPASVGTKILATTNAAPDGDGYLRTAWVDIDSVLVSRFAFIRLDTSNTVQTTESTLSLGTNLVNGSGLSYVTPVSGNPTTIQGLVSGKLYVVTFALTLNMNSAGSYFDTFTFSVVDPNGDTVNATTRANIDETIAGVNGMPNYVNGTVFFTARTGQTQCYFTVSCDRAGWTVYYDGSLIQISEVK